MKNKSLITLMLIGIPVGLFAQNPPNRPVEFWIKPHIANVVTSQRDSIPNSVMAAFTGSVKATLLAVDTVFSALSTAIDTSRAYRTADGAMSVDYTVAGGDSIDCDLEYWSAPKLYEFDYDTDSNVPPPISRFRLVKSLNITSAGSGTWHIDDEIIPSHSWCMFRWKGNADNDTGDAATAKLKGIWYTSQQ